MVVVPISVILVPVMSNQSSSYKGVVSREINIDSCANNYSSLFSMVVSNYIIFVLCKLRDLSFTRELVSITSKFVFSTDKNYKLTSLVVSI